MKNLVAFFEIPASDFCRAVKFYETVLSQQLSVMESETEKMAFFPAEEGKSPGAISWAEGFLPSAHGVLISLHVNEINETLTLVVENGGQIIRPKTRIEAERSRYFSIFIDCEGNQVGLYSDN